MERLPFPIPIPTGATTESSSWCTTGSSRISGRSNAFSKERESLFLRDRFRSPLQPDRVSLLRASRGRRPLCRCRSACPSQVQGSLWHSRVVPRLSDAMIGADAARLSWLAWRRCEFYRQRCIGLCRASEGSGFRTTVNLPFWTRVASDYHLGGAGRAGSDSPIGSDS